MTGNVLTVIHDLDGYHRWRQSEQATGHTVLTWNSQVYRECSVANIDCLDAIELVGPEAVDRAYEAVIKSIEDWWQPQLAGLSYRGIDLAETMDRDMAYPFLDGLIASKSTRRALDMVQPAAMEVVDCGRRAFFWDPPGGPYPGVANGVALFEGERWGVPSTLICKQPTWTLPKHGNNPPPKPVPNFSGQSDPSLLFLLSTVDLIRLRPLLQPIFEGEQKTFLALSGDIEVPEAGAAQLAWFEWLAHFPVNQDLSSEIRYRCDSLMQAANEFQKQHPCLFDNPFIDFQWEAFAHRLELGGRIVDATTHLLETLHPDVCVLGTATAGNWRCITATARRLGIPVASIHHTSILPEKLLCGVWHHDADKLLIEGKLTRDMYERWGRPPDSLEEIGYPLVKENRKNQAKNGSILIVPNEWDWGFAIPAFVSRKKAESLQELAELAKQMPDRPFVLKPHPRSLHRHLAEYQRAASIAPNLTIADPNGSIVDFMDAASVVIMLDSCSQAFLDACMSGAPVVHHRPATLDAECNRSLQDKGYVPITRDVQELSNILESLFSDDDFRSETTAFAERFITDFSCINNIDDVRDGLVKSLASLSDNRKGEACCS